MPSPLSSAVVFKPSHDVGLTGEDENAVPGEGLGPVIHAAGSFHAELALMVELVMIFDAFCLFHIFGCAPNTLV